MKLVREVYLQTKNFPAEERFLLVDQLRRSAVSVCSNIAEGASRISKNEKKRFFEVSRSSLVEIDTQIEISMVIEFLKKNEINQLE